MHPRAAEGRARQAQREMEDSGTLDEQRAEFEARIIRRALVRHAEARMNERPRTRTDAERRRIGENLWRLLDEIEQGPRQIRKAQVLQEAINATPEDSTKHLPRYACRPTEDSVEAERRTRHLLKTVKKFVHVAKVAARLAGLDPDEVTLRVLEGSYYTQRVPPGLLEADFARRTDVLAALLSDIAHRLCRKYPVVESIRRMESAGWALRAPGDLKSPMCVDPTLLDERSQPPRPGAHVFVEWAHIERYPHLHLGYVSGEKVHPATFGRVAGKFVFQDEDGARFETDFDVFDVRCQPVFRVDLVLLPGMPDKVPELALAFGYATWIKPTTQLKWSSAANIEYFISEEDTIGEIDKFIHARDGAGFIDLSHGIPLKATKLSWPSAACSGSLMLITDSDGCVNTAIRPPRLGQACLDAIQPLELSRERVWLAPAPFLLPCDQPILHRHFASTPQIAHLWTDERPDGPPWGNHPLAADPVPAATSLDPIEAPEGSLSARLERWMSGTLDNRPALEEDLESAILTFLARIEATLSEARSRLAAAVYGRK